MLNALTLWLISVMTIISPPERDAARAAKHNSSETGAERAARYESIAADIAAVTKGHALPGQTEQQTAALLVAVTFYESSFHPDVDDAECNEFFVRTGHEKQNGRCDGGISVGLMQLHLDSQKTFMGKTFDELAGTANRQTMLAAGLRHLRAGIVGCSREWKRQNPGLKVMPGWELHGTWLHHSDGSAETQMTTGVMTQRGLAWYARNACESKSGMADGEKKIKLARRFFTDKRFPKMGEEPVEVAERL